MKKTTKAIILSFIALSLISFKQKSEPCNFTLTIQAEGIKNSDGVILFALYNREGSIPDQNFEKFFKKKTAKINSDTLSITFENIPKGKYAVSILHDENQNGKLDKKFVLPKEGIGFSNYETIDLSNRPNFKVASFELNSDLIKKIKMIYK